MVMWSLRRCRNTKLWKNKLIAAVNVLLTAKEYLHEWQLLQQTAPNQSQHAAEHERPRTAWSASKVTVKEAKALGILMPLQIIYRSVGVTNYLTNLVTLVNLSSNSSLFTIL